MHRTGHSWELILGVVQLSYFEKLYQSVVPDADTALSLFRRDGMLLVRFPHDHLQVGWSFGQTEVFKRLNGTGTGAIVSRIIGINGADRVVAANPVEGFPIAMMASATVPHMLAQWRQQAWYLSAAAVVLEVVGAMGGLLVLRQLRDQHLLHEARAAQVQAEAARLVAEADLTLAQEKYVADRAARVQDARFGAALSTMSQALCMFDASNRLIMTNRRLAQIFQIPAGAIFPGMTTGMICATAMRNSCLIPADLKSMRQAISQLRSSRRRASHIHELADGRALAVNYTPMEDDCWLVTLEDITESRVAEAKIAYMAHHDFLSGLPNRVLFRAKLSEAVARSRRGETFAILYLDLDHFKGVNDTLGHPVGDALLIEVTRRLAGQVRETDILARLGGDEFAIIQSSVDRPMDVTALAARLIEVLGRPYQLDDQQIIIGTSVGIAVVPGDGTHPDLLLKNAEIALYRAKKDGRARYRFFEPGMDAIMQARRTLEMDLRTALTEQQFAVFYQPLMNIQNRSISGFEALIRWFHPERGMVSPAEFIALAEETGLIVPLGQFVLHRACADAVAWPANAKVAVNLSPVQFESNTLVADVAAALADSGTRSMEAGT